MRHAVVDEQEALNQLRAAAERIGNQLSGNDVGI